MGKKEWERIATIRLENISKQYRMGEVIVKALGGLSLEIALGEFVVILGPSDSGKTTLFNLIGALDTPTSGNLWIDGKNITHARRTERFQYRREIVSFIFQLFHLFPGLTALENVQFGLQIANHGASRGRPIVPTPTSALVVPPDHRRNRGVSCPCKTN